MTITPGRHYSVDWTTGLDYWTHGKCLWRIKEQNFRTPKSLATLPTALQVVQFIPSTVPRNMCVDEYWFLAEACWDKDTCMCTQKQVKQLHLCMSSSITKGWPSI